MRRGISERISESWTVLLGNGDYDVKLQQVPPILEKLAELYPDTAGTLHLENYDSDSESISFVPAG